MLVFWPQINGLKELGGFCEFFQAPRPQGPCKRGARGAMSATGDFGVTWLKSYSSWKVDGTIPTYPRWWFQILFIFTPT